MKKIGNWVILTTGTLCALSFFSISRESTFLDSSIQEKSIAEILKKIPKKDQERIEYFFSVCIGWEGFGYVLLGEKPMAFSGLSTDLHPFRSFSSFRYAVSPRRAKFEKSYKTWKKYEKLFPMTRFVFLYEEDSAEVIFTLVNKKSFVKTVDNFQSDFESVLNRSVNGVGLLEEASQDKLLKHVLFDHDLLIGILLGYGRHNAFLYYQRSKLPIEEIEAFDQEFHFVQIWDQEEIASWEKKFKGSVGWISAHVTGEHLKKIEISPLPGFMAVLNHRETKRLKEQYLKTRKKLIEVYKDGDFLETTLKILVSTEEIIS